MAERQHYTNRLINEKSPYLLQHAHNPVDWYPWGEEAFRAAKDQDKPIFLSVGYATCHWCHVMERESFEDAEVARLMNDVFINIKVDREELPHVDSLYMEFAQSMMAGAAGWPLNVILTSELQPFFAATYLPPQASHGMMGLTELVQRINEVWNGEERERILAQAAKIVEVFAESVHVQGNEMPEKEQIDDTAELLFKMSDPVYGGMKGMPKFPIGYQANLMMQYSATTKDSRALFMVERTLDMMQRGGIYDHLGGGFSRYSVDKKWMIPHFEKMLYDNALLIFSYLEAWQITKKNFYRQVCEEIIDYILRDIVHPEGGFYSAEDADSEGHEGRFYTWTLEEIQALLGKGESNLFCEFYDVLSEGNFEGRNILHTEQRLEEFAEQRGLDAGDLAIRFHMQRQILWKARETRPHPFKDDKILSSWNGLMIFSLANAGCAFGKQEYINAAVKAAAFIREKMWKNGQLYRRWREGDAFFNAGLDEYAFLIKGLISLFEADCGTEWLQWALEMTKILNDKFKIEDGAYFQTDEQEKNIILRKTQFSDGAEPSGNAVHAENLLRLYAITSDPHYLDQAEDIFRAVKKFLDNYSPGYCYHIMNLNRYFNHSAPTLAIALNQKEEHREAIKRAIFFQFIPHKSIVWRRANDENLFKIAPALREQVPLHDQTTLYLCRKGTCEKPAEGLKEILDSIQKL
jgi:uncharacterized protein YyaL (SSP411 family)